MMEILERFYIDLKTNDKVHLFLFLLFSLIDVNLKRNIGILSSETEDKSRIIIEIPDNHADMTYRKQ